jgi:hypothetical protein
VGNSEDWFLCSQIGHPGLSRVWCILICCSGSLVATKQFRKNDRIISWEMIFLNSVTTKEVSAVSKLTYRIYVVSDSSNNEHSKIGNQSSIILFDRIFLLLLATYRDICMSLNQASGSFMCMVDTDSLLRSADSN